MAESQSNLEAPRKSQKLVKRMVRDTRETPELNSRHSSLGGASLPTSAWRSRLHRERALTPMSRGQQPDTTDPSLACTERAGDPASTPAPGSEAQAGPPSRGHSSDPESDRCCRHPLTLQVGDHRLVLVLELGQALRFLLLFREVGGELGYSVFQQLLLLEGEGGSELKVS